MRARDQVVGARRKLINHVRGAVKSLGGRIALFAEAFATRAAVQIPAELRAAITPLLELITELTERIKQSWSSAPAEH